MAEPNLRPIECVPIQLKPFVPESEERRCLHGLLVYVPARVATSVGPQLPEIPMTNTRFHLSLTTVLAMGLGATLTHALTPSTAVGYPAGAAVSYGTNPVISAAGTVALGSSSSALTTSADQELVITDAILSVSSSDRSCRGSVDFTLRLGDGTALGHFTSDITGDYEWVDAPYVRSAYGYSSGTDPTQAVHFTSGIRLPAGDTVVVHATGRAISCGDSSVSARYTLSGYLAQP